MSTTWILVKDQRVQNVIVATPEVADAIRAKYDAVIEQTATTVASVGDSYDESAKAFVPPKKPVVTRKELTKLEFRSRLTQEEKVAIYLAAEQHAEIKVWLADFDAAANVDVTDARLIAGLQSLSAAGLLSEPRVLELLEPVTE